MAQKPTGAIGAHAGKTLRSPTGLELVVIGPGEPAGREKIATVRVKRVGDGGIRDIPREDLESRNGRAAVANALDKAASEKAETDKAAAIEATPAIEG